MTENFSKLGEDLDVESEVPSAVAVAGPQHWARKYRKQLLIGASVAAGAAVLLILIIAIAAMSSTSSSHVVSSSDADVVIPPTVVNTTNTTEPTTTTVTPLLLRGGQVINHDQELGVRDVLLVSGKISKISAAANTQLSASDIPANTRIIDCTGKLIMPGGIDPHTHIQMPFMGTVTVDDWAIASRAAVAGGTTTILDFVMSDKTEGSMIPALNRWMARANNTSVANFGFHMALGWWNATVSNEMATLVSRGVTSFKHFMAYKGSLMLTDSELAASFARVKELGGLADVHAEPGETIYNNQLALIQQPNQASNPLAHARSRPPELEGAAAAKAIQIAKDAGNCPINIVHTSSALATAAIKTAQAQGQAVWGEVLTIHLTLDESRYVLADSSEAAWNKAAAHVMSPPLRNKTHVAAMWQAVQDGVLTTVGTDHCAFNTAQKRAGRTDFRSIPNGVPGLEERLYLLWNNGVNANKITRKQFVSLVSTNSAKLYNMYPQKGRIAQGSDADVVVWDPTLQHTFSAATQQSKTDINVLEGTKVTGSPIITIVNGVVAYERAKGGVVAAAGLGKYVSRLPFGTPYHAVNDTVNGAAVYECDLGRMANKITTFSKFGDAGHGGITRYSLSAEAHLARNEFVRRMTSIGATIETDDMANIYATIPGSVAGLKRIATGSHADSVKNGGNYDGILGVLGAMEVLDTIVTYNIPHRHPITAMIWTNEEGSLYPPAMMSSGVLTGKFNKTLMLASKSVLDSSKTFGNALAASPFRGDVSNRMNSDKYMAFLELHIEQGPILEKANNDVGVVTCVIGMVNYRIRTYGQSDHAGTTPMGGRRDALYAAAKVLQYLHDNLDALNDSALVYTTGEISLHPNVHTVIPDYVDFSIDIRHENPAVIQKAVEVIKSIPKEVAKCTTGYELQWARDTEYFHNTLVGYVKQSVEQLGISNQYINSGAGHDAQYVSAIMPTTMIFVPSKDGHSHCEIEYTSPEQCTAGASVLLNALLKVDAQDSL